MTISCRKDLSSAKRVVIKAGTSVVSTPEGFPSLSRMAGIVEQVILVKLLFSTFFNFDSHARLQN